MTEHERPFFLSKDSLDTLNSVCWFLMDASWMLQQKYICYAFVLPTILTGVFLCYIDKRKPVMLINIAVLSWICMNTSWMMADFLAHPEYLTLAKGFFVFGICFVLFSIALSKNVFETFSHFKRFRNKKFWDQPK